ncbi:PREDICTED: glycerol-3-phosphate 2-O-acyltransferase 6-like [Erythranthe guttata]|uniref:glycerol-3-phosphate 2-O-acyltransferase 6-like n=1 Tax=Erythranthe guttata TaxID=4155 RepID=UPI00064DCAED|nr:PREDICTED: glycerol-3-phosphate 2-O-acyltransferase 6-like [Erythranthe guttata]|eukprot:XP_012843104.1 PREDICTED: glycerol-3-phosphate 2-O-acyltransferase 6-like [Erythranthe guttata]
MRKEAFPKPVIFHDGRLVGKPTPLTALLVVLWFPIGVLLSLLRVFSASHRRHRRKRSGVRLLPQNHPRRRRITTTTISYSAAAKLIGRKFMDEGKSLVMFPEETTGRGPYLLIFSPLFAEISDQIVPVAVAVKTSVFHGTTARGYKWLDDPFFFYMNPFPAHQIIANNVQKMIAQSLKYEASDFTRRDKYRAFVGSDGHV